MTLGHFGRPCLSMCAIGVFVQTTATETKLDVNQKHWVYNNRPGRPLCENRHVTEVHAF